jgi:hypothetical protein
VLNAPSLALFTVQGPLVVYNAHLEVFCGLLARIAQLSDIFADARRMADRGLHHQAILGEQQAHVRLQHHAAARQLMPLPLLHVGATVPFPVCTQCPVLHHSHPPLQAI